MTKALSTEVDERTKRTIWKGMTTKSVRQLADETGLSVNKVVNLRNEMLEAVDALTLQQRRMKLMIELQEISDDARAEFESTPDARSKAPLLSASISAMKLVLTQLKEMEAKGDKEVDSLNLVRQREIVEIFESAMVSLFDWLETEHGVQRSETEPQAMLFLQEAAVAMEERNNS